ncbi:hypothetical protein RYX36_006881 [Vicia faba]
MSGATCLVASPAERERGGTSKLAEAVERDIPVVREAWLTDSIEKQEPQPLEAYDLVSDLSVTGKGIPWDKQDPGEEAIESLSAEVRATCLVASPAERERGGTSKLAEAVERDIPVVREAWLTDSIEKQEPQPLEAYDLVSDLSVTGKGIPWDKQDPGEEAIESLSAEVTLSKRTNALDWKL